jgi:V8-like Glu-specific endopeptidase
MTAILKLFINYENLPSNSYAHGTGWLIRPDLMVTAGHNVYSWRRTNGRLPGRAREIKAYAGYNGAKSISDSSVEFRRAKRVVTTSQWLDSASSRPRDFALVQFDQPFTDVTPFQYIETPASGDLHLGVVGYPADLKDPETGERGGKMYELFEQTKYDITADPDRMLAHYIDSEGGKYSSQLVIYICNKD